MNFFFCFFFLGLSTTFFSPSDNDGGGDKVAGENTFDKKFSTKIIAECFLLKTKSTGNAEIPVIKVFPREFQFIRTKTRPRVKIFFFLQDKVFRARIVLLYYPNFFFFLLIIRKIESLLFH